MFYVHHFFPPMKIIIPERDHIQTYAYILCIGHLGNLGGKL